MKTLQVGLGEILCKLSMTISKSTQNLWFVLQMIWSSNIEEMIRTYRNFVILMILSKLADETHMYTLLHSYVI